MKTTRVTHNIEHITRIHGSKVLADVSGQRVDILAFTIGKHEDANFVHLLMPIAIAAIKAELMDLSGVQDAHVPEDWRRDDVS